MLWLAEDDRLAAQGASRGTLKVDCMFTLACAAYNPISTIPNGSWLAANS